MQAGYRSMIFSHIGEIYCKNHLKTVFKVKSTYNLKPSLFIDLLLIVFLICEETILWLKIQIFFFKYFNPYNLHIDSMFS